MPYVPQSPDTTEAADRAQFAVLRRLGRAKCYEQGLRLVEAGYQAQWRKLEQQYPDWTREQLLVEWVRVQYGEELAARYSKYLECKSNSVKSVSQ